MEELMKESSSALGYTPPTVRQLVIALQNNLSESFDQDHDENDYVNISWLVVVLQSHLDLVLMCWLPSWWHWWHIFVGPSFHDSFFVRFPMALDRIIRGQGIHIWFHLCHIWLHLCHIWLHPCTWVIFGSTAWTVALNLGQRGSRQGKQGRARDFLATNSRQMTPPITWVSHQAQRGRWLSFLARGGGGPSENLSLD